MSESERARVRRPRAKRRALFALLAAAAVLAGAVTLAWAAPGDLTYVGCVANDGAHGCADPASDSLDRAFGVAVSPDGTDVYVSSSDGNSVTHLSRGGDGSLAFAGCVANDGAHGCANPANDSLDGAHGVAVSPDGDDVYVASFRGNSVTHLSRGGDGSLAFAGCVANGGANGCANPANDSLGNAFGIALSPDGTDVYVISDSIGGSAVTHLSRAGDGSLAFRGCVANSGAFGCADPGNDSLDRAFGVAVSPDGDDVYVASFRGNSVTHLSRGGDGSLAFAGCVANDGAHGCANPANDSLGGAHGVAVSPDGDDVYVASFGDSAVTHLSRAGDGSLAFRGCVANSGGFGCADPGNDSLGGAAGVAVSPDGADVYVVLDITDGAVTHLSRGGDGSLAFAGCVANGGAHGCANPANDSLRGALAVAVSPDGADVYVAAAVGDSVTHLSRELPPPPSPPTPPTPSSETPSPETPDPETPAPPPTCRGEQATVVGTPGPDRLVGTPGRDVIVAGAGDDQVIGAAGDDLLCAGRGADFVGAGHGSDRVLGRAGDDRLVARGGDNLLNGGPGRDVIVAGAGEDRVIGAAGDDRVAVGRGDDIVTAGHGNDRVAVGHGNDRVLGRAGDDRLVARGGDNLLNGGPGRDRCVGGPGRDLLRGCER